MPGSSELEENKIFKDIALGTAGKDGKSRVSNRQNYRDCPLWSNLKKKKTKSMADLIDEEIVKEILEDIKSNTVNK